jgi:hypothetical protein
MRSGCGCFNGRHTVTRKLSMSFVLFRCAASPFASVSGSNAILVAKLQQRPETNIVLLGLGAS